MILSRAEQLARGLRLWRLRAARVATLAPTTVLTALAAIAVLVQHRLAVGRGHASLLAARPAGERRADRAARSDPAPVRRAA